MNGESLRGLDLEAGGHRFQRVPPTEKRGRVHTSTVTVAVIHKAETVSPEIDESEFSVSWFSGTGKGGQHRNKHQNSCRVTHVKTGLVETRQGRKRAANLSDAKAALIKRIMAQKTSTALRDAAVKKKSQVGSGMRADKSVTIRYQDNTVKHHKTGKVMRADQYMKGKMDLVW